MCVHAHSQDRGDAVTQRRSEKLSAERVHELRFRQDGTLDCDSFLHRTPALVTQDSLDKTDRAEKISVSVSVSAAMAGNPKCLCGINFLAADDELLRMSIRCKDRSCS